MPQQNPFDQFDPQPAQGSGFIPFNVPQPVVDKNAADLQGTTLTNQGKATENAVKTATAAPTIAKAQADAIEAKAKADAAQRTAATLLPPNALLEARNLGNDEILRNIADARALSNTWTATGMPYQFLRQIGGTDALSLDTTNTSLKNQISSAKMDLGRQAGTQQRIARAEFNAFGNTIAPLDPRMGKVNYQSALAAVENHYRRLKASEAGLNPDDPQVQKAYGIITQGDPNAPIVAGAVPPAGGPPAGGNGPSGPSGTLGPMGAPGGDPNGGGFATSAGKIVDDPVLAGVNDHVSRMITSGATAAQIAAYLNTVRPGLANNVPGIDQVVAQHNADPRRPVQVDVQKAWKPSAPILQGINANNPMGALMLNGADMLTAGNADSLVGALGGNPAQYRALVEGVNDANPRAALAGQLGGGALAAGLTEAAAARLGLTGIAGARAADAAYGAAYGAGSADGNGPDGGGIGDRIEGAVDGGLAGLVGGMFGRGAAKVGGRVVAGVVNPAAKALADTGIPLTVGQILGGGAKAFEDKITSRPIVGSFINARRADGYKAANNAAFNLGLQPIGKDVGNLTGEDAVRAAQGHVGNAYSDALDGVTFNADPQFALDLHNAKTTGSHIPQLGPTFSHMVDNRVSSLIDNGQLTGRGFQDALRGVRDAAASAKPEIMGHEFGQASGQVEDALRGLVERQHPELLPKYDAANAAYRNLSVLQDATLKGSNTGGIFTPAQLGMAAKANAVKYSGKGAAAAGDVPFFDFQRAAQDTLPSKIPDSGTAARLATIGMFGAALGGGGGALSNDHNRVGAGLEGAGIGGAALGLLAAAPYSKASQRMLQSLLLNDRPAVLRTLGNGIVNQAPRFGAVAAPAAARYVTGGQ
jgi:hypothetical protein